MFELVIIRLVGKINEKEKREFKMSDIEKWRQWIRKKAVDTNPLTSAEAKQIPKDKIISHGSADIGTFRLVFYV